MSKDNIKQVAITHFYKFGYEGVKMAKIAEDVGIRKQSLAYHYPSKRELFTEIYQEVIEDEQKFIHEYFNHTEEQGTKEILYQFLVLVKLRAYDKISSKFLQSISYSTPLEMESFITAHYFLYLGQLKNEIRRLFEKTTFHFTTDECIAGFIVLYDGLITHLLYNTRQSFEYSLNTTFDVFWRGIQA
jgi:TetR/AcrR family transcriptional regulator, biofilm operon repressor